MLKKPSIKYSLRIFDPVMKKIFFFFCFALAIILPNFLFAEGVNSLHNFKISQKQTISIQSLIQDDVFLNDVYLIGEADDDINDTERKSLSLQKASLKTLSFVVENYIATLFKNRWSNKYFFHLHSSLFIFLSVIRI